jgi:hypothetical protein
LSNNTQYNRVGDQYLVDIIRVIKMSWWDKHVGVRVALWWVDSFYSKMPLLNSELRIG